MTANLTQVRIALHEQHNKQMTMHFESSKSVIGSSGTGFNGLESPHELNPLIVSSSLLGTKGGGLFIRRPAINTLPNLSQSVTGAMSPIFAISQNSINPLVNSPIITVTAPVFPSHVMNNYQFVCSCGVVR